MAKKKITKKVAKTSNLVDKKPHLEEDDNPSWYHYLIVLGLILLIFLTVYGIFVLFAPSPDETNGVSRTDIRYPESFKIGNITYNIEFHQPKEILEELNYTIDVTKQVLWNSPGLKMSFYVYDIKDNSKVIMGSTKLINFLRTVYHTQFTPESFVSIENYTCDNSTLRQKIMVFEVNENITTPSVTMDPNNGCIELIAGSGEQMLSLVDKWILELMTS